jgi:hypothetical protein
MNAGVGRRKALFRGMESSHAPDTDVEGPVIPLTTSNDDATAPLKAVLTVVVDYARVVEARRT